MIDPADPLTFVATAVEAQSARARMAALSRQELDAVCAALGIAPAEVRRHLTRLLTRPARVDA